MNPGGFDSALSIASLRDDFLRFRFILSARIPAYSMGLFLEYFDNCKATLVDRSPWDLSRGTRSPVSGNCEPPGKLSLAIPSRSRSFMHAVISPLRFFSNLAFTIFAFLKQKHE